MDYVNFCVNDIDNLNVLRSLARTEDNVSIFSLNAQRICHRKKFAQFADYIDSFLAKPLVLGVSETWFKSNETGEDPRDNSRVRLYELGGYQATFSSRDGHSAGIALYVWDGVRFEVIEKSNGPVSFIHARVFAGDTEFYVTLVYMPRLADYPLLLTLLERLFSGVPGRRKHVLIGDFNIDLASRTVVSASYSELLRSFGYMVSNDRVTRPASESVIDHVIVNFDGVINYTVPNGISDHNGVLSTLSSVCELREGRSDVVRTRVDLGGVRGCLGQRFSDLTTINGLGADEALNFLTESVAAAVRDNSRVECSRLKSGSSQWANAELLRLGTRLKRMRRKLKGRPGDTGLVLRCKALSHDMTVLKRRLKRDHVERLFSAGVSDTRQCWKALDEVMGRKRRSDNQIRLVSATTGVMLDEPIAVADELNRAFVEPVVPSAVSRHQGLLSHGPGWSADSMVLFDVDEAEIFEILSGLGVRKSVGHDGISNFVLKGCARELALPLAICVNKAFHEGVFPDRLKVARVTPIFKGGSAAEASSYRPISVLSCLDKIYELALASRLKSFLRSQGFLYEHQYGFRTSTSTSTAALEALDFVFGHLDRRGCGVVSALMIDLRRAFDSVDHSVLLRKLYAAGVRGLVHDLLTSYLTGRSQFVRVGSVDSSRRPVQCGVPQGSVLGPLLFLVFLNDVAGLPLFGKLFLYADDALLLYAGVDDAVNASRMCEDLEMLDGYFCANKLMMNTSKTKFMHFHDPHKRLGRRVSVSFRGVQIEEVRQFDYLGVVLDSNLTWRPHVDRLCSSLSRAIGLLYRVRDEVPRYALKRLYFGIVHSKLMYMVSLWANAPASCLARLQTLQNRLFKLIYRLPILTPTLELYRDHVRDVLPLKGLQVYSTCKRVRESLSGEIYHTVQFGRGLRAESLRDRLRLSRPTALTAFGTYRLSFQGPTFYNSLPASIRELRRVGPFLGSLRSHLLLTESLTRLLDFRWP